MSLHRVLAGRVAAKSETLGVAGERLWPHIQRIERRSGLAGLIPNTFNLTLDVPYTVVPDFVVTRAEDHNCEELRFRHCTIADHRCLIVRPDTHEAGYGRGRAYLEIMATVWLRAALGVDDGDAVDVTVKVVR